MFATGACEKCLGKLKTVKDEEQADCSHEDFYFDGGRCSFAYSTVNDSIYRFKYMGRASYAKTYARLMVDERLINPDALIPVPMHKKRLIKRGYNQATELAVEISRLTKIPVNDTCIIRQKNTIPQKLATRRLRSANMKKAFIVIENVVNLRRVVIIDDIFTTGSTVDSMAKELKKAGVKEVYFLTFARAGI